MSLLFLAPVLILLWLLGNLEFGWFGDRQVPVEVPLGAIAASALLGFAAPRATPTVSGWITNGFHWLARLW